MTMWVFGYGSLLWNPEFPVARREVALLRDYARSFCMRSIHHRGSVEEPGLVLALDKVPGHDCSGLALMVEPGHETETLQALRERELISSAYLERHLEVELASGERITTVTYIIDPNHDQYCHLDLEEQAQIIARSHGKRGANSAYLFNTADHLAQIGLADADLTWLATRVRAILA